MQGACQAGGQGLLQSMLQAATNTCAAQTSGTPESQHRDSAAWKLSGAIHRCQRNVNYSTSKCLLRLQGDTLPAVVVARCHDTWVIHRKQVCEWTQPEHGATAHRPHDSPTLTVASPCGPTCCNCQLLLQRRCHSRCDSGRHSIHSRIHCCAGLLTCRVHNNLGQVLVEGNCHLQDNTHDNKI